MGRDHFLKHPAVQPSPIFFCHFYIFWAIFGILWKDVNVHDLLTSLNNTVQGDQHVCPQDDEIRKQGERAGKKVSTKYGGNVRIYYLGQAHGRVQFGSCRKC